MDTEEDFDDAERLRRLQGEADNDATRSPGVAGRGTPSILVQTKQATAYPTNAQRYFTCVPASVFGAETEGGPGTVTPGTGSLLALNLGSAIPPVGTSVLCTFVNYRWVFVYNG